MILASLLFASTISLASIPSISGEEQLLVEAEIPEPVVSPCLDSVLLGMNSVKSCDIKTYTNKTGGLGYYCQLSLEDRLEEPESGFEVVTFWAYSSSEDLSKVPSHYMPYCADSNLTLYYF